METLEVPREVAGVQLESLLGAVGAGRVVELVDVAAPQLDPGSDDVVEGPRAWQCEITGKGCVSTMCMDGCYLDKAKAF